MLNPRLTRLLQKGAALVSQRARRRSVSASSASSPPPYSADKDTRMDHRDPPVEPNPTNPAAQATASMQKTLQAARASSSEFHYEPLETDFSEMGGYRQRADESGPTYTDLGSSASGYKGNVTPFSDDEIFDGTLELILFGYATAGMKWRPNEVALFKAQFATISAHPPVTFPRALSFLKIGEALASYGVGHGMAVGEVLGRAEDLPDWVRLILFAALTSAMSFRAMKVVQVVRQTEDFEDPVGAGRPGPGFTGAESADETGEYAGL